MHSNNPYAVDKIRRSLIHFIFGKGVSAIVGFSLLFLLVRVLTPAEYGIYIALLALLEITQLGSNLGLFASAWRYVPELHSKNQGHALYRLLIQLCSARLATLLIATIAIYLGAQWVTQLTGLTGHELALTLYLIVIVSEGYSRYLDILFDSLLLQGYSQISILFRNALRLIGLLYFMYISQSDISLISWIKIEMIASSMGAIFSSVQLFRHVRKNKLTATDTNHQHSIFHKYLSFAGPSYLSQLVFLSYGPDTAKLIITKVLGAASVGAFGFAAAFVTMLQRYMPVFLLLGMVRPLFVAAQLQADKDARLNLLSNMILKLNLFILGPMLAYFIVSGDTLAKLLSGGKFPDAGGLMIAFIILLIIQTWNAVLSLLAIAAENGFSALNSTILGLLGLGLGLYLLPTFGVYGLSAGLITSECLRGFYLNKVLSRRGMTINWDSRGITKIALSSILSIAIVESVSHLISTNSYAFLPINFALISLLFLISAFFLKPFTAEERGMINRILPVKKFIW